MWATRLLLCAGENQRRAAAVQRTSLLADRCEVSAGVSPALNEIGEMGDIPSVPGLSSLIVNPLSCLPFWREGQSSVLPRVESALKRPHIFVPALLKFQRQTGARALVRSSAVRHNGFVLRDSRKNFFELVHWYSNRFWQHGVRFRPSLRVTNVDQHEFFSGFHSPLEFVNSNSRSVSHRNLLEGLE